MALPPADIEEKKKWCMVLWISRISDWGYAGKMGVGCKTLMAYQSMFLWKMNVWLSMVALVVRLCEADQQMHLLALQN